MKFEDISDIKCVIINLDTELSKYHRTESAIREIGFENIERYVVDSEELPSEFHYPLGVYASKFQNRAEMSCAKAHLTVLEKFLQSDEKYLLIFEDDAIFHTDFHQKFSKLGDLTWDKFDVLFLGGWVWGFRFGSMFIDDVPDILEYQGEENYIHQANTYETHAYLVNRRFAKSVLKNYNGECGSESMSIDNFYVWMIDKRKFKSITLASSPEDSTNKHSLQIRNMNSRGLVYQISEKSSIQNRRLEFRDANDEFVDSIECEFTYSNYSKTVKVNHEIVDGGLHSIPDGILTKEGLSMDGNRVFSDISWFGNRYQRDKRQTRSMWDVGSKIPKEFEYMGGRCLNMFPIWSDVNYYHYLIDFLGRLSVLEQNGVGDYDHYYLPLPNFKIKDTIMEKLYIPKEKIVKFRNKNLKFDLLDAVIPKGDGRYPSPSTYKYVRDFIGVKSTNNPTKKLYVKRKGTDRRIYNEKEVEDLLYSHGFMFVHPEDDDKVWETFSNAKMVVGIHGAGLTNCVFCSPGSTLVEFMPENRQVWHFPLLSKGCEMNYHSLLAFARPDGSYMVDVKTLEALISTY